MNVPQTGAAALTTSATARRSTAAAYALFMLTVVYAFNYLDRSILSLVLPQIKAELALSDTALGLISGFAFVLFYSILGVPIAWLADRHNRRNIIGIGFFFWSLMTAATGFVANAWQLAAARFLMGAGEACGISPSNSMIGDLFSKERRPFAMSIMTAGNGLGMLLLFPLVGWIAHTHGWRAAFMSAGVAGCVIAVVFMLTVSEPQRRDDTGRAVEKSDRSWTRSLAQLLSNKAYRLTLVGGAFMGISLYASIVWNPSFLVRVHQFDLMQVSSTIGPMRGFSAVVGVLLAGWLADRLGRRDGRWRLWVPGIATALVFPADLVFLLSPHVPTSMVGLAFVNLFGAMHVGPLYAVCVSVAGAGLRATASAVFLFCGNLVGQVLGPLIVGSLNDHLQAQLGDLAIRYSMLAGAACALISGLILIHAARSLDRT